jgi:hypothetical protein
MGTPSLGPGLRLINARLRMRLAVLGAIAGEAGARIDSPWAGSDEARDTYAEMSAAARELVTAQDEWDAAVRAKRAVPFDEGYEKVSP